MRKRFEQKARNSGLTRSQWQAIAYLSKNEGIHQGALAELLEIEPITLVRILDKLVERGLVERRQHGTDRRIWLLFLKDAARPLLADVQPIAEATRAEALSGVTRENRDSLLQTLELMKTNLMAANTSPDPRERGSLWLTAFRFIGYPRMRRTSPPFPRLRCGATPSANCESRRPKARRRKPAPAAAETPRPAPAKPANAPKRGWKRPLLFALLPVALVAGGYFYVTGGQITSTDNAYVQAEMEGVSTDVAGTVVEIDVHDNEAVKKGQVLYRLKPDTYQIALDGAKAQLGTVHDQVLTLQASYKLALAQIDQAEADLSFYQVQFKRQQDLVATGAGTKMAFDSAKHDLDATEQKIKVAKAQAEATLAQLGGNPNQTIEQNPFYLQAKSGVDNAQRDLNDTVVQGAVRRRRDQCRRHPDRLLSAGFAAGVQPRFDVATSGWRRARRKRS